MKCSYCGAENAQGKSYCTMCGTKLEQEPVKVPEIAPVRIERNIPDEPKEPMCPKEETDYPQTRAIMAQVLEPVKDLMPPLRETEGGLGEIWDLPAASDSGADTQETEEQAVQTCASALQLPVGRSLLKMILLGLITAGIYPTVIWSRIVTELNIAASRNDGKRTMPYFGMMMLTPITFGVFSFVWMHRFCNRVGNQLKFRSCDYRFGARDFWLWCMLGSLILVGPFVFVHKLMKSMNLINAHYNTCG